MYVDGGGTVSERLVLEMEGESGADLRAAAMERDWPPEEWRRHPEFLDYIVSDRGAVRSIDRIKLDKNGQPRCLKGRPMRPSPMRGGYPGFTIRLDSHSHLRPAHRLVLEAFRGPRPAGHECRHLDGNVLNNRLDNLKWGTPKENKGDTVAHGRSMRGEKHRAAKLNAFSVRVIRRLVKLGHQQNRVAVLFGVRSQEISRIIKGERWGWLDGGKPPSEEWVAANTRRM